jgi:GNAT superfamily N-acetyltransferase
MSADLARAAAAVVAHDTAPDFAAAVPEDAAECVRLRGLTRENAVPEARLRELGITAASWGADIRAGTLPGFVCRVDGQMAGYCFGNTGTGEIVVLALLPEFEERGLGRQLLQRMVDLLRNLGHTRLFLGCAADPAVRSHGFYRHLGWCSTGQTDSLGDEVLELVHDAGYPPPEMP